MLDLVMLARLALVAAILDIRWVTFSMTDPEAFDRSPRDVDIKYSKRDAIEGGFERFP